MRESDLAIQMIGYSHPVDPRLDAALEGRLSLCLVLQAALDGRNCCAACSKSELLVRGRHLGEYRADDGILVALR